jgi:hypothetical protein
MLASVALTSTVAGIDPVGVFDDHADVGKSQTGRIGCI